MADDVGEIILCCNEQCDPDCNPGFYKGKFILKKYQPELINEIYEHLCTQNGIQQSASESGEPLYWMDVYPVDIKGKFKKPLSVRVYNTSGTKAEIHYQDQTWRIRDDKLGQFIIRLFQDSPSEKVREISCMGLNCYSVVNLKDFFSKRGYYIKTENGPIKIGEGYGFIRRYEEYVVDRDRDGLTELICECVDNMSGSQRVFVYRREGNIIKRGRINPYKLEMTGWTGSLKCDYYELYDPERRVFIVRYTCTDKNTKTITIADYSGFEWEDYACISD